MLFSKQSTSYVLQPFIQKVYAEGSTIYFTLQYTLKNQKYYNYNFVMWYLMH